MTSLTTACHVIPIILVSHGAKFVLVCRSSPAWPGRVPCRCFIPMTDTTKRWHLKRLIGTVRKSVIIMGMSKAVPIPLNDANLLRIIRDLAKDSENVRLRTHARDRMKQRGISFTQVLSCLRKGTIDEAAHESIKGDWKCTLRHQHAGDMVRVAVAIEKDGYGNWIAVVTVF